VERFPAAGAPWTYPARRAAAAALRTASAVLARMARRVAVAPAPAPAERMSSTLEFYADAGAPEGALYLDGKLVGFLPGVKRL